MDKKSTTESITGITTDNTTGKNKKSVGVKNFLLALDKFLMFLLKYNVVFILLSIGICISTGIYLNSDFIHTTLSSIFIVLLILLNSNS